MCRIIIIWNNYWNNIHCIIKLIKFINIHTIICILHHALQASVDRFQANNSITVIIDKIN